ncbi:MAG: hypothetical protein WCI74_15490, partial [Actinomycetes bacterium]
MSACGVDIIAEWLRDLDCPIRQSPAQLIGELVVVGCRVQVTARDGVQRSQSQRIEIALPPEQ